MCNLAKFSEILNNLMEEENLNNKALAKLCKISEDSIRRYRDGENYPTTEILIKLSSVLNVSVSYLLGETDIRNADDTAIGLRFGIDDNVINNLEEIKKINDKYEGEFKDMVGEIITDTRLYETLANIMKKTIEYYKTKDSNKKIIELDLGWNKGLKFDEYCDLKAFYAFFCKYATYKGIIRIKKELYGNDEYSIRKDLKKYRKIVRNLEKKLKDLQK